jgi:acetyl-CoA C-acetyltransferase
MRHFASFLPKDVFIGGFKRTPIGRFKGVFSKVPAPVLGGIAIEAVMAEQSMLYNDVEEAIMGNVLQAGVGQNPARQAALYGGLPYEAVCTTINKLCASGMKSVMYAASNIALGQRHSIVAGGFENMTRAPFIARDYRFTKSAEGLEDVIFADGLTCAINKTPMGSCHEKTVEKYELTREQIDDYCIQSYQRAAAAWERGFFKGEVTPVNYKVSETETVSLSVDEEYSRVDFQKVRTLKPAFGEHGTITPANASSIDDAGAALLILSEQAAYKLDITPMARILNFQDAETDPVHFAQAPIFAIEDLLVKTGLKVSDIDLWEINEAFSSVPLLAIKTLELDPAKLNVNGGAVSLGHPLGFSGARITGTLAYALKERKGKYGIAAVCNGGGGASAILIENLA